MFTQVNSGRMKMSMRLEVICNHIFKRVKFIKGEGANVIVNVDKRNNSKNLVYIKYHERADLAKITGYEYALMKSVGLTEENSALVKQFLWWKTYNNHVR